MVDLSTERFRKYVVDYAVDTVRFPNRSSVGWIYSCCADLNCMASDNQPYPLGDFSAMVAAISRATDIPKAEAEQRLRLEFDHLGNNVLRDLAAFDFKPFEWNDGLDEFYGGTQAFLFESLTWNDLPAKQEMRRWIVDYLRRSGRTSQRILCCGDGLGFDSTALASQGHRTTYFEVSIACRKFAGEVFANNNVTVETADSLDGLEANSFDAVVCLDVLEHVPHPSKLVEKIARLIRPDGLLITHAPFWLLDESTPTHLHDNMRYSGEWRSLYGVHGLSPIAGRFLWNPLVLKKAGGTLAPSIAGCVIPAMGGVWLKFQRIWSWPFRVIVRAVLRVQQRQRRRSLVAGKLLLDD